jgi:hypothetical protein
MRRLLGLVQEGKESQTGLPRNHPITRFACEPDKLDHVLMLDDVVFLGALPLLVDAGDGPIARLARSLKERLLPKCIDVRRLVDEALPRADGESRTRRKARIALACSNIENGLRALPICATDQPERVFIDRYERMPYKRYQDSETPLNRILMRSGESSPHDMAELSPVVAGAETFEVYRAYVFGDDTEARGMVENIIRTELKRGSHDDA